MWVRWTAVLVMTGFAVQDQRTGRIKVRPALLFAAAGMAVRALLPSLSLAEGAWGLLPGIVLCLIAAASDNAIGMGDGLLAAGSGAWLGIGENLEILMLAFLLAGFRGIWLLMRGAGKRASFPFIPYIAAAQLICLIAAA